MLLRRRFALFASFVDFLYVLQYFLHLFCLFLLLFLQKCLSTLFLLLLFLQPRCLTLGVQLFLEFLHFFSQFLEALRRTGPLRRRRSLIGCNFCSAEVIVLYRPNRPIEIFQFFLKLALLPLSLSELLGLHQLVILLSSSQLRLTLLFCHLELALRDPTGIRFVELPYRWVRHWLHLRCTLLFTHANKIIYKMGTIR